MTIDQSIKKTLDKMILLSKEDEFDVFNDIQWPKEISKNVLWTSNELITLYGTKYFEKLSEQEVQKLSQLECVYFFSLNVSGIKELLIDVVGLVHKKGNEEISEYLHYLIKEENEHMYYFARFCLKYGEKLYQDKNLGLKSLDNNDKIIQSFLTFMRIVVFEVIVDFFNIKASKDKNVHTFIRKLNELHHKDESRHIAFGVTIVKFLFRKIQEEYDAETISNLQRYTREYMRFSVLKLYNPNIYREIGIINPTVVKRELLEDEIRIDFNNKVLKKLTLEFSKSNILTSSVF